MALGNFMTMESSAQKATGLSLAQIKSFTPCQLREHLEKTNKAKFSFVSVFPYIGRGNVLRENIIDSATLDREIDKILK